MSSHDAPSQPLADVPVTDEMLSSYSNFDTNGHDAPPVMRMARELTKARACIREQQAALEEIAKGYSGVAGRDLQSYSGTDCGDIARAALTKWRIE